MDNMPNKETIEKYITENDENGDGQIDFSEFCDMMQKCETQAL
jgi:Ca2+-binding EF-hand superfamily protein